MKTYKAIVTDKETRERKIIERAYKTKGQFITDLRKNGFAVNIDKVKESEVFDWIIENTNCEKRHWQRGITR